nr:M20/M25/M40 family metallo-hydrolase [candidate division KSB1 bacterium]NIR73061.1 M20/M25/M40 family metallo-hydrolase [candidate division KSB1 bacterium]NIS23834.1 M20/M25/M40 family metallo-hydrolase [candidate division KSB1 bacterium]NIT70758.1 M20/M25/M40 family metallo-hydrolase [candidate division KSB1 bacterium]NIU24480.1 M20/M25/M40 family metallo-hydrolase [candidate division KSB1 bacterium]
MVEFKKLMLPFVVLATCVLSANSAAEDRTAQRVVTKVREYRAENELAILNELFEFVAIPNVASDTENIERNAKHLVAMLEKRGLAAQILRADGGSPAVYGELNVPGAERTVVVYMHYDGQPVNAEKWDSEPWQPVFRKPKGAKEIEPSNLQSPVDPEGRIYARSVSDDKAPIVAMLTAIDALQAADIPLSVNLKFFLEGEEEAGSPHLAEILEKHKDLLSADVWLFCDGPVHQRRRQQVVFGVRGVIGLSMTAYGAVRPLHSGHYGNWAPNPIVLLVHLLASMRDPDGN